MWEDRTDSPTYGIYRYIGLQGRKGKMANFRSNSGRWSVSHPCSRILLTMVLVYLGILVGVLYLDEDMGALHASVGHPTTHYRDVRPVPMETDCRNIAERSTIVTQGEVKGQDVSSTGAPKRIVPENKTVDSPRAPTQPLFGVDRLRPTNYYDLSNTQRGPILRVRHLVEANSRYTTSRAVGPGLHRAGVGVPTIFSVLVNTTRRLDFDSAFVYSALAVGDNHMFTARMPRQESDEKITFTYTARLPGVYQLYVEEIHLDGQYQVPGSPFRLTVQGSPVNDATTRRHADHLPSCQSLPQTDLAWEGGSWVSRKYAGDERGTLRSGWVYQRDGCGFDIFSKNDLHLAAASSKPTFILVLGSSTDRGIFLSLVDIILAPEEKVRIAQSDIGKCWGYAQVRVGSLRVAYQDFRIESEAASTLGTDGGGQQIECHDEKRAIDSKEGNLLDAIGFIENMFSEDPSTWPDVISTVVRDEAQFRLLVDAIPQSWNGTIYPLCSFKTKRPTFYTYLGLKESYQKMKELLRVDHRVRSIDAFSMLAGMRHNTQSSPLIMKSNHLHRGCCELGGEMRYCGDTAEMLAQMFLGRALAPTGKQAWRTSLNEEEMSAEFPLVGREIVVCFDCPGTLLPIHIIPKPNLTCYHSTEGVRSREHSFPVWDGKMCPDGCMKTSPVGKILTESGSVNVRRCELK